MGGSTTQTTAIKVANIQIQTSSYGLTKPVVYGTNRLAANLLWFGAFTATPHTTTTSQGGKGLGKVTSKDTTFTYSAAAILGLCEGPIAGIGSVWRDKDKTTLAALGLSLFTGTATQAVWSYLTGYNVPGNWTQEQAYGYSGQAAAFTDQAINYSSTAYVAASAYDLGSNATVPNHGFEIQGKLIFGSGIVDASPAAIVPDMLTSTQYGAGMALAQVGSLASYANYIQATGLFVSPTYESQRPTHDCLSELVDATNSAVVWSGGILSIIPYGDTALTGNGATYTPAVTPLFDFADDDFQGSDDPVRVTRSSPADAINRVQVEFLNRANQYNAEVVTVEDQDAIEKFGLKPASTLTLHMICNSATAKLAAQLYLQRMLYKRNTYEFELDARYPMLEPMDVVTLTDAGQGMTRLPVRLTMIEETDHGFKVTAEDLPIGIANAATYVHDNGLRWQSIINVTPANCAAPIIFELPADPSISSAKGLSVAIAVGGQTTDPLYGGCRVWLSLDGTNYKAEGTIYGSSRYGLTTAILPAAAAGLDSTNTLSLGLRSNAQMVSGSAADRDKHTTLLNIGGEYLSFMTAALTGVNAYNVTSLNRALFGTSSAAAKASGSTFVYVDSRIAILKDLDLSLIGQTVYIKVTAFNTYGTGEQDISTVSAYNYTITGNMKALQTPVDFATGVGGTTKPEQSATRGNTLVYNGGAESGIDGWIIDETAGAANTLTQSSTAEAISGGASFKMQKAATGDSFDIVGRKIAVVPGKTYIFKARVYGSTATATGMYLRFNRAGSNFVGDYITAATRTGFYDLLANGAINTTIGSYELGFMASAGDYYISPAIYDNAGGPLAIFVDDISVAEQIPWGLGIAGIGKPENNATADDNMVSNGAFVIDSSNWVLSNATWAASPGIGYPSTGVLNFPASTLSSAIANNNLVRPLNGAATLFCSAFTYTSTGAAGAFNAQIDFYDSSGALVSSSVNSIQQTTMNAWLPKVIPPIAVPASAVSFIASFQRPSAAGIVAATNLRVAKTQFAATVGSQVGVNLLDQGGTQIATDPAIKNSAISANPNGTLNNAGGGAVTLTGIAPNVDPNATRNRYARQGTDPGFTEDYAVWGDTSGVMARYKVRRSGAWDLGATDGAQVGGNLLDQSAASIASDAAIKNSSVSVNPNGTLNNAGGGGVTAPGLGVSAGAGTALNLTPLKANASPFPTIVGNTATNATGTAGVWEQGAISKERVRGGASVSGIAIGGGQAMIGLTTQSAPGPSYTNIDYALYYSSGGNYTIYPGGLATNLATVACAIGDNCIVVHDDVKVRYYVNGTLVHIQSVNAAGEQLRLMVALYSGLFGIGWSDLRFSPTVSNDFANTGGTTKPANNATVGADLTNLNVTIGGGNLVKNSSFEGPTYTGGNGPLPAGFNLYSNADGAFTSTSIVAGRTGGNALQVAWTVNTSTKGFYFLSAANVDNSLMFQPNTTMMVSYYAKATGVAVGLTMGFGWNTGPASTTAVSNPALTTNWQRYVFRLVWGAAVDGNGYVTINGGNGTATLVFDDVQVEMGDTVTAYGGNTVARVGSNLYDISNAPIATDAAIKNASVTMGSNGVLGGSSGGGAITALAADNLVDGSIYGRYALTERTKLSGVAAGADVTASQPIVSKLSATTGNALVTLADTNGRRMNKLAGTGNARDADVISFGGSLPSVPNIVFLPGGNAASSGSNIAIQASSISVSGFTMKARSQAVTAGTTYNDSTAGTRVAGDPDLIVIRSNATAPFDGNFTFTYSVHVGLLGGVDPGTIDVQFYVRKSGSWVNVGSATLNTSGSYTQTVTPGTVDYAAGVAEFGISKSYGQGTATAVSTLGPVTYSAGTVTETILTPAGSSAIPWLAMIQ